MNGYQVILNLIQFITASNHSLMKPSKPTDSRKQPLSNPDLPVCSGRINRTRKKSLFKNHKAQMPKGLIFPF